MLIGKNIANRQEILLIDKNFAIRQEILLIDKNIAVRQNIALYKMFFIHKKRLTWMLFFGKVTFCGKSHYFWKKLLLFKKR